MTNMQYSHRSEMPHTQKYTRFDCVTGIATVVRREMIVLSKAPFLAWEVTTVACSSPLFPCMDPAMTEFFMTWLTEFSDVLV